MATNFYSKYKSCVRVALKQKFDWPYDKSKAWMNDNPDFMREAYDSGNILPDNLAKIIHHLEEA